MASVRVKGLTGPDISAATFWGYLDAQHSPVPYAEAGAVYAYCVQRQVSPAFLLGMFQHESQCGKAGTAVVTHSWGNTRMPSYGGVTETSIVQGRSGTFPVYRNWIDGGISTVARLCDHPAYQGKDTVQDIIPVWAPASDLNDPANYVVSVLAVMARLIAQEQTVSVPKPPMTILDSPNRDGYSGTRKPEAIVWHITEGTDSRGWLTSPASKASANYLIERDGTIYQLVPPDHDAWANGAVNKPDTNNSLIVKWLAERDSQGQPINFNQRTVSIEHEGMSSHNNGGALTDAQVKATVALTAWLCDSLGIPPDQTHILGHYQIDDVNRTYCPGFSSKEWYEWVRQVAEMVNPPAPAPDPPPATDPEPTVNVSINDAGETVMIINFRGNSKRVKGYVVNDAGVTTEGVDGADYSRSIKVDFLPWVKH